MKMSNIPLLIIALVNDNKELASRASMLLVRMCGVTPPRPLVDPIFDAIFDTIQQSPVSVEAFNIYFILKLLSTVMEGALEGSAFGTGYLF